MGEEFNRVSEEFRSFNEKMRDPLVVGALLNKLAEERQSTNLLFKSLLEKIESLEGKVEAMEAKLATPVIAKEAPARRERTALSDVDERIIKFIAGRGKACAEELQMEFGYKGRNAASSRLNALFKHGLLDKVYAGKTVYFQVIPKPG